MSLRDDMQKLLKGRGGAESVRRLAQRLIRQLRANAGGGEVRVVGRCGKMIEGDDGSRSREEEPCDC